MIPPLIQVLKQADYGGEMGSGSPIGASPAGAETKPERNHSATHEMYLSNRAPRISNDAGWRDTLMQSANSGNRQAVQALEDQIQIMEQNVSNPMEVLKLRRQLDMLQYRYPQMAKQAISPELIRRVFQDAYATGRGVPEQQRRNLSLLARRQLGHLRGIALSAPGATTVQDGQQLKANQGSLAAQRRSTLLPKGYGVLPGGTTDPTAKLLQKQLPEASYALHDKLMDLGHGKAFTEPLTKGIDPHGPARFGVQQQLEQNIRNARSAAQGAHGTPWQVMTPATLLGVGGAALVYNKLKKKRRARREEDPVPKVNRGLINISGRATGIAGGISGGYNLGTALSRALTNTSFGVKHPWANTAALTAPMIGGGIAGLAAGGYLGGQVGDALLGDRPIETKLKKKASPVNLGGPSIQPGGRVQFPQFGTIKAPFNMGQQFDRDRADMEDWMPQQKQAGGVRLDKKLPNQGRTQQVVDHTAIRNDKSSYKPKPKARDPLYDKYMTMKYGESKNLLKLGLALEKMASGFTPQIPQEMYGATSGSDLSRAQGYPEHGAGMKDPDGGAASMMVRNARGVSVIGQDLVNKAQWQAQSPYPTPVAAMNAYYKQQQAQRAPQQPQPQQAVAKPAPAPAPAQPPAQPMGTAKPLPSVAPAGMLKGSAFMCRLFKKLEKRANDWEDLADRANTLAQNPQGSSIQRAIGGAVNTAMSAVPQPNTQRPAYRQAGSSAESLNRLNGSSDLMHPAGGAAYNPGGTGFRADTGNAGFNPTGISGGAGQVPNAPAAQPSQQPAPVTQPQCAAPAAAQGQAKSQGQQQQADPELVAKWRATGGRIPFQRWAAAWQQSGQTLANAQAQRSAQGYKSPQQLYGGQTPAKAIAQPQAKQQLGGARGGTAAAAGGARGGNPEQPAPVPETAGGARGGNPEQAAQARPENTEAWNEANAKDEPARTESFRSGAGRQWLNSYGGSGPDSRGAAGAEQAGAARPPAQPAPQPNLTKPVPSTVPSTAPNTTPMSYDDKGQTGGEAKGSSKSGGGSVTAKPLPPNPGLGASGKLSA